MCGKAYYTVLPLTQIEDNLFEQHNTSINNLKFHDMKQKKISFSWDEKSTFDSERVGAMYCFKRCDVNQN